MAEDNGWLEWQNHVLLELKRYGKELMALREEQADMRIAIQGYNSELREHIRGVRALEERNKFYDKKFEVMNSRLDDAELPVVWAQVTGKIMAWVGAGAGVLYGLYKVMERVIG